MLTDIDIPAEELRDVLARVAVFARTGGAATALHHVRLEADGALRHWVATDTHGFAYLAGGVTDAEFRVSIPPRLLSLPEDVEGLTTLSVPTPDPEDGDALLQLGTSESVARCPPGPEAYPDWPALLDEAVNAEAVAVTVGRSKLSDALAALPAVPTTAGGEHPGRCWLTVSSEALWLGAELAEGDERVLPAGADGETKVLVDVAALGRLLALTTTEHLDLRLPLAPGGPLWTAEDDWTGWIRTVDLDAELAQRRDWLAQTLRDAYGWRAVRVDDDGTCHVAVDGATVTVHLTVQRPATVRASTVLLDDVARRPGLIDALNDVNAAGEAARVFWRHDQVVAETAVPAERLDQEALGRACRSVLQTRDEWGAALRRHLTEKTTPTMPTTPAAADTAGASEAGTERSRVTVEIAGDDVVYTADGSRVPPWPFGDEERVHVISAYNPSGESFSYHDNERAHAQLHAELRVAGYGIYPAALRTADGTWLARAIAVSGLRSKEAAAVGRRYGQAAVFELVPQGMRILSCEP